MSSNVGHSIKHHSMGREIDAKFPKSICNSHANGFLSPVEFAIWCLVKKNMGHGSRCKRMACMGRRYAWGGGMHGEEVCMGRRYAWGGGMNGEVR